MLFQLESLCYFGHRQCRINHMAEAAYATGPALLGAPRLLSSIFSEFLFPCFSARPKQCVSAGPYRAQVRPHQAGPKRFFVPCFSVSAWGPKESMQARSSENVRPQNLKIEVPNSRTRNGFFVSCFSAGSKQRGAPKSPKRPLKAKPPNKKHEAPK